jgi:hypothetical protein
MLKILRARKPIDPKSEPGLPALRALGDNVIDAFAG